MQIVYDDDVFIVIDGDFIYSYSEDDEFCIRIDEISEKDKAELLKYKDNPYKAFDECGLSEIFRVPDTINIFYSTEMPDIIYKIVYQLQVRYLVHNMTKIWNKSKLKDTIIRDISEKVGDLDEDDYTEPVEYLCEKYYVTLLNA